VPDDLIVLAMQSGEEMRISLAMASLGKEMLKR